MSSSQETCPEALQLLNASRKGVQAARVPPNLSSPADCLFLFVKQQRSAGLFAFTQTFEFETGIGDARILGAGRGRFLF